MRRILSHLGLSCSSCASILSHRRLGCSSCARILRHKGLGCSSRGARILLYREKFFLLLECRIGQRIKSQRSSLGGVQEKIQIFLFSVSLKTVYCGHPAFFTFNLDLTNLYFQDWYPFQHFLIFYNIHQNIRDF